MNGLSECPRCNTPMTLTWEDTFGEAWGCVCGLRLGIDFSKVGHDKQNEVTRGTDSNHQLNNDSDPVRNGPGQEVV